MDRSTKSHNANSACVQGKCKLETGAAERPGAAWKLVGDFKDPQLNALEEKVDVSNQSLRAAVDRFQEARDVLRQSRSSLFPSRHGERNTLAKPPIPAQGSVRRDPPSIIRIWSRRRCFLRGGRLGKHPAFRAIQPRVGAGFGCGLGNASPEPARGTGAGLFDPARSRRAETALRYQCGCLRESPTTYRGSFSRRGRFPGRCGPRGNSARANARRGHRHYIPARPV